MTFDDFVAKKDADRAVRDEGRVTWRRVDALTGGGWSGYGRDGRLVWVRPSATAPGSPDVARYDYGILVGRVRTTLGTAEKVLHAKRAAAALTVRDDLWSSS